VAERGSRPSAALRSVARRLVHRRTIVVVALGASTGGGLGAIAVAGIPRSFAADAQLSATPMFDVSQYVTIRDLGITQDAVRYGTVGQLGELATARAATLGRLDRPGRIDLTFNAYSNQLRVTGRAQDARTAVRLTDSFASEIVTARTAVIRRLRVQAKENRALLVRLDPGSRAARRVVDLDERLKLLATVPGVGVQLQRRARLPSQPAAPRRPRDILASSALGALLAPWAAALVRRIRTLTGRRPPAPAAA